MCFFFQHSLVSLRPVEKEKEAHKKKWRIKWKKKEKKKRDAPFRRVDGHRIEFCFRFFFSFPLFVVVVVVVVVVGRVCFFCSIAAFRYCSSSC